MWTNVSAWQQYKDTQTIFTQHEEIRDLWGRIPLVLSVLFQPSFLKSITHKSAT